MKSRVLVKSFIRGWGASINHLSNGKLNQLLCNIKQAHAQVNFSGILVGSLISQFYARTVASGRVRHTPFEATINVTKIKQGDTLGIYFLAK